MFKSYLPAKFNTWFVLIHIVLILSAAYNALVFFIFFHICLYLLFRRMPNRFRDNPMTTTGVVFSPCNGKIVAIKRDDEWVQLEISIYPWKEMGIFMPISAEVKNLWRVKKEVILELTNKLDVLELRFFKRTFGFWPELIVSAGDKGARQVNVGFFPFGGTLTLSLPKKYEILIKDFTEVVAGETIIAVLPEKT